MNPKGSQILTANDGHHLAAKVALRVEAVRLLGQPRPIQILDAYHGPGQLWKRAATELVGWDINLYRADTRPATAGTLRINNAQLLAVLDLDRFDLIDLDAYGWPTAQLRIVAKRAPTKLVVTTRITAALAGVPKIIADDLGFRLPKGAPKTLIVKLADELWEAWLYHLGYRTSRLIRYTHTGAVNGDPGPATQAVKRYETLRPAGFPTPPGFDG